METARRRNYWKEALIVLFVVLLICGLVWLFLRPEQPGRQIVFGDLGQKPPSSHSLPAAPSNFLPAAQSTFDTNAEMTGEPASPNRPPTNALASVTNGDAAPITNEPAVADDRAKRDAIFGAIARNASNSLVGRYVAVTNFEGVAGTNSNMFGAAMTNPLSSNPIAGMAAMLPPVPQSPAPEAAAAQNAMARTTHSAAATPHFPAPTPVYSDASQSHSRYVPVEDPAPPEPLIKSSTSVLLAQASAAGVKRVDPRPLRTSELLGTSAPLLFDSRLGTNVVFLLDNSLDMMTNGKSAAAREQLVHSLESMDPMHSFYVLFFHSGGFEGMPSLGPMAALPENICAMTNWLFSAGHRSGGDPSKAMQRALGLAPAPDVIWILSGSATPENSIDSIRGANASIHARIFTIGFYARDAEDALRQIAGENRGAYSYVPPPEAP